MASPFYSAGTVSLVYGTNPRRFIGAGTAWLDAGVMAGDDFKLKGNHPWLPIASVGANGQLDIAENYYTGANVPALTEYIIKRNSPLRLDPLETLTKQNRLLRQHEAYAIAAKTLMVDAFGLTSPPGAPTDGYTVVVAGSGATGPYAGRENRILVYNAASTSWEDHDYADLVTVGWSVIVKGTSLARYYWNGTAWTVMPISNGDLPARLRSSSTDNDLVLDCNDAAEAGKYIVRSDAANRPPGETWGYLEVYVHNNTWVLQVWRDLFGSGHCFVRARSSTLEWGSWGDPTVVSGDARYARSAGGINFDVQGVDYVPDVAAMSGSYASVAVAGRYKRLGRLCFYNISASIADKGTASGLLLGLPFTSNGPFASAGAEIAIAGFGLRCSMYPGDPKVYVSKADGGDPAINGVAYYLSGLYEVA